MSTAVCLQAAWQGEEFAGLIALDERRGAREGVGWISFCYLAPAFRGRGLGVQLLGAAVSRCRELGRERLCLSVARDNPALGVYERWGFRPSGTEPGALEPLLRMEKDLRF